MCVLQCLEAAFPAHDARFKQLFGPAAAASSLGLLVEATIDFEASVAAVYFASLCSMSLL